MPCPEDFEAWFRLLETPGVGRQGFRRLLTAFGHPEAALAARQQAWREVLDDPEAPDPADAPPAFAARLQQALVWLAQPDHHALVLGDAAYPARLLATADPPLLLYVQGPVGLLAEDSVAIVGSRQATAQGLQHARRFAHELVQAGWRVGSGLAVGVDAAAHEGALGASAGRLGWGSTFAVVGTGLDTVYPRAHADLARRILADGGALVSEYAPGTPALPPHFPQRNRILAGLSAGTLVVEAALRSGSLITARLASESGREVMAIPGPIDAPQSQGCHALIQQGAQLVTCLDDLVDALPPLRGTERVPRDSDASPLARRPSRRAAPRPAPARRPRGPAAAEAPQADLPWPPGADRGTTTLASAGPTADEARVLQALGHAPSTLDALQARLGWPTPALLAALLNLELAGQVARLPGGLYQRQTLA
ncbi:MAG: DNA-processing protein DprA [Rubrivivax sp.]|jgi:DNA processing protein